MNTVKKQLHNAFKVGHSLPVNYELLEPPVNKFQ
jgi:hypothetical protein